MSALGFEIACPHCQERSPAEESQNGRVVCSSCSQTFEVPKPDDVVTQVMDFVSRFVVMAPEQLTIVALWVIHTHCIESVDQTPYLAVTSPERQCGKTRLLETLEVLVARPWMAVLPSEAVVYRSVHKKTPTLLLDEVDAIFNPRLADRYEGLRALLNAGHRRGATVPRCLGKGANVVEFKTFCAKVLAGIGTLPDTVADRSLPIRLVRRTRQEKVHRFIRRDVEPVASALREQIEAWAEEHASDLVDARPEMPEELSDRMQEGCECLVAIADRLGRGERARQALIELFSHERLDERESMQLRLLRDIRVVFKQRDKRAGKRVKAISTQSLLKALKALDEAPWGTYYGRGLGPNDLAALLRAFDLHSTTVRFKSRVAKGYKRDDLHGVWERYLG